MAYIVNISGDTNATYAYATVDEEKIIQSGTYTYNTKPAISVYLSGNLSVTNKCQIVLNGETVKTGGGSYELGTEAETVDIVFKRNGSSGALYYTADIIAEETPSDPMTPKDGHNTNIGGAANEVEAGTTLLDGVEIEIESGIVLSGGVGREIKFGPDKFTVTLGATTNKSRAYVTVGGTEYTDTATIEAESGTELVVYAKKTSSRNTFVYLNDDLVLTAESQYFFSEYKLVIESDITVEITGTTVVYVYIKTT